jgi:tetratricopeptide (TPR) repeat protein
VLERAYERIGEALAFLPAEQGEKIVVEIFPDARGLSGATGLTIDEIETSGTIAVCKFHRLMVTSPLATANGYSWADTLAHEFTHLVISKKSHNTIPIWLHEGIAKYYESLWRGDIGMALSPSSEKLLAKARRKKDYVTFEEMHPSMAKLPSQEKAALAFAEVFTVIRFVHERFGLQAIAEILEHTRDGAPLEKALKTVIGMGLKKLERAWKRYLKTLPLNESTQARRREIQLAANEEEAQQERPMEVIEDRVLHDFTRLGELMQLRGHHHAAIIEYEKAYEKAGVKYPTLAYRLARAYVDVGQGKRAQRVLEESLAHHTDDSDAMLLLGRILFTNKVYAKAQKYFEEANLFNPFNPEIHAALAKLFEMQGATEDANRSKRFFALAAKPRARREFDLPPPDVGEARVNVVTPNWRPFRLDGGSHRASPAWGLGVTAGEHAIEYDGETRTLDVHIFTTEPGVEKTLLLR